LGATRDPDLVRQIGRLTALEMLATGIPWNFSPVVAVVQDVRWGRTYEGFKKLDFNVVVDLFWKAPARFARGYRLPSADEPVPPRIYGDYALLTARYMPIQYAVMQLTPPSLLNAIAYRVAVRRTVPEHAGQLHRSQRGAAVPGLSSEF
jgi:hypothetical protein